VVVSFDQMRGDYPEAFRRFLTTTRGFGRIMDQGAWFDHCYFDQASMMTAPGHATLLTGCYPWKTGITANDMCERSTRTCAQSVHDATYGTSPVMLKVPTLGDALRARDKRSKVVSIAFKDRAAVLMGGHDPTCALWYDTDSMAFVTSDYYQRPPWLSVFNAALPLEQYAGRTWRAGIPDSLQPAYDDIEEEGTLSSGRRTFPHRMPRSDDRENFAIDVLSSPFSVTFLFDAAVEVMRRERLGQDTVPDVLSIGVSTTDILGHQFGPDSREVQELFVGCDTTLARFIDVLDARVGREHYVLVITSDHGVAPIPEYLARQGEPQGVTVDAGRMRATDVVQAIDSALTSRFGTPAGRSYVRAFLPPSVHLDTVQLVERGIDVDQAVATVITTLRSMHGIQYAIARRDLIAQRCSPDVPREHCRYIMQAFDAERCGDVIIVPRQYWIFGGNVATHGTPYDYDRHVPLMFFGAGIAGGRITDHVAPVDIAPTLAKMLGVNLADVDGMVLRLK
jgi:hypothetical protein